MPSRALNSRRFETDRNVPYSVELRVCRDETVSVTLHMTTWRLRAHVRQMTSPRILENMHRNKGIVAVMKEDSWKELNK